MTKVRRRARSQLSKSGRFAKVSAENQIFQKHYTLANLCLEVNSDIRITDKTFAKKFDCFEIPKPLKKNPLEEKIKINHHFNTIDNIEIEGFENIYFKPPWAVYTNKDHIIYHWIKPTPPHENYFQTMTTNQEHTRFDIYHDDASREKYLNGNLESLSLFPTDQILTGRFLAYKNGCIIHSLGVLIDNKGYLFVGHSDAGKSTMALILESAGATILCDDRNIIRKTDEDWIVSGTWSHGDVKTVSSQTAPLAGIFFLNQHAENTILRVEDDEQSLQRLLACLIRPLETKDWWEKSLDLLDQIIDQIPCYNLYFNKTGEIKEQLNKITTQK